MLVVTLPMRAAAMVVVAPVPPVPAPLLLLVLLLALLPPVPAPLVLVLLLVLPPEPDPLEVVVAVEDPHAPMLTPARHPRIAPPMIKLFFTETSERLAALIGKRTGRQPTHSPQRARCRG
jgi:hypothetical protein